MGDIELKLLCFGKELEVKKMTGRLLHVGQVLDRDKGFLIAIEFIYSSALG